MKNILVTVSGEDEDLGWVALSQTGDALFLTDSAGEIKFISAGVERILGYTPAEIKSLGNIGALLGSELFDRTALEAEGEIGDIERIVLTKSGDERYLLIHVKIVSSHDGALIYTCRDITERKRARQALRKTRLELAHASRLAFAGQLMASIAHEVNQPLTSIVSNADAALITLDGEMTNDTTELHSILYDIRTEGERVADVVRRLRAFIRRQPIKRQPLDLSRVVHDSLLLIRGEVNRHRVTLRTELASSLPQVEGDPISIQQVVLNIVVNAMEAMDDLNGVERVLTLETRRTNGSVEIIVGDNGSGIPNDHLDKVFEPFFTTKEAGLGLGLAIARSIVEEHGGAISVTTGAGRGARFHVKLPCHF